MLNSKFPAGITIDILSRLPFKTLVRFRCVCKPWLRLLTGQDPDPYFTILHARKSFNENPNPVLLHYVNPPSSFHFTPDYTQFDNSIRIKTPEWYRGRGRVEGICNGLVCIRKDDAGPLEDIYIWNPITAESLKIPRLPWKSNFYRKKKRTLYGFAFSKSTNEYKVIVVVVSWTRRRHKEYNYRCEVNAYTLGTDTWETLEDIPFHVIPNLVSHCGALVNGALHWLASEPEIVSFNLESEAFQEMRMPESIINKTTISMRLAELSGGLATLHVERGKELQVWVMKEYGVQDSWTKQFSVISSDLPILHQYMLTTPLGVANNGDVVTQHMNGALCHQDTYTRDDVHLIFPRVHGFIFFLIWIPPLNQQNASLSMDCLEKPNLVFTTLWRGCKFVKGKTYACLLSFANAATVNLFRFLGRKCSILSLSS